MKTDPAHARIGDEWYNHATHEKWQLQPEGWKRITHADWPVRDVTTTCVVYADTSATEVCRRFVRQWQVNAFIARYPGGRDWDDSWAEHLIDDMAKRITPGEFNTGIAGSVASVVCQFHLAAGAGKWEEACDWRLAVRDLRWNLALYHNTDLAEMIEVASDDMHGGCAVSFDGDCFEPPPWSAHVTGWPFKTFNAGGNTPEEALRRAMKAKDTYVRAEAAKPRVPAGVGDISFDAGNKDTGV